MLGKIFTSCELLELSLVPIPSNASALSLGVKALKDETTRKSMKSLLDGEHSNFGHFISNSNSGKIVNELNGYIHNFCVVVDSDDEVPVEKPMAPKAIEVQQAPVVKQSVAAKILDANLEDIFGEMATSSRRI